MITKKSRLKKWFENFKKPTQEQFWAWMDSYWHKNEKIPIENIKGLDETFEQTNKHFETLIKNLPTIDLSEYVKTSDLTNYITKEQMEDINEKLGTLINLFTEIKDKLNADCDNAIKVKVCETNGTDTNTGTDTVSEKATIIVDRFYEESHPNENGWNLKENQGYDNYMAWLKLDKTLSDKDEDIIFNVEVLGNQSLYKVIQVLNPKSNGFDGSINILLVDNWKGINYPPTTDIRITTDDPRIENNDFVITIDNPFKTNTGNETNEKANLIVDKISYNDDVNAFNDMVLKSDKFVSDEPINVKVKFKWINAWETGSVQDYEQEFDFIPNGENFPLDTIIDEGDLVFKSDIEVSTEDKRFNSPVIISKP